jgi:hypothetical protein
VYIEQDLSAPQRGETYVKFAHATGKTLFLPDRNAGFAEQVTKNNWEHFGIFGHHARLLGLVDGRAKNHINWFKARCPLAE